MQIDITSLGITKEQLIDRVVDGLVEALLEEHSFDENGRIRHTESSAFTQEVQAKFKQRYDDCINKILDTTFLPVVQEKIDAHIFQETNTWGEKIGAPLSTTEYFIRRIEAYIREDVDGNGKAKRELDSYNQTNWRKAGTRLAYAIDSTIHREMSKAVQTILSGGIGEIARALNETARTQLNAIAAKFTVEVKSK